MLHTNLTFKSVFISTKEAESLILLAGLTFLKRTFTKQRTTTLIKRQLKSSSLPGRLVRREPGVSASYPAKFQRYTSNVSKRAVKATLHRASLADDDNPPSLELHFCIGYPLQDLLPAL